MSPKSNMTQQLVQSNNPPACPIRGELGAVPSMAFLQFHQFAHQTPCQVSYDVGCRHLGMGVNDGEGVEVRWSTGHRPHSRRAKL
ncbi:hypothetical protein MSAN_01896900 [Mycena sanguinolenta]|uniref:Uncharacterized protein n=1 Tax=Mycena sanguinolenta TaxID=230812 RepID=A0A8H7CPC6_9AGAR|nr:hypothetical protein MSAN_01896900 [Mycena sanguinolenta]